MVSVEFCGSMLSCRVGPASTLLEQPLPRLPDAQGSSEAQCPGSARDVRFARHAASTSTSSESSSAVILSLRFVADRRAVAGIDAHAIDLDAARGRHEIEIACLARRIFRALAGLQRGGEHPRIGADRQRVIVRLKPLAMVTSLPERFAFGNGLAPQVGWPPCVVGWIQIWKIFVFVGSRLYSE